MKRINKIITLPIWALEFDFVQEENCKRPFEIAFNGGISFSFENDEPGFDDEIQAFENRLNLARIGRDSTIMNEMPEGDIESSFQKVRYLVNTRKNPYEVSLKEAFWSQDDERAPEISRLFSLLKDEGANAVVEHIKTLANHVGLDLPLLKKIQRPDDDMMFSMAIISSCPKLVTQLATPQRVSSPLIDAAFGHKPLSVAFENDDLQLASLLSQLGARVSDSRTSFSTETIAQWVLSSNKSQAVKDFASTSLAAENARLALQELMHLNVSTTARPMASA